MVNGNKRYKFGPFILNQRTFNHQIQQQIQEASEHYSLRYTEVYAVECMYLRRENSRLKEKLASLEERLEKLEKAENQEK